jgi:drug/metabolite transporter (DMT)-like permease
VLAAAAMSLARRRRLRPLQIISLISFCVGIALVVIEAALRRYFTGELLVTWSVLGFACLTAVSVVVLYLHRSLQKRHRDIRRYLHL